jgi:hypothetical protein
LAKGANETQFYELSLLLGYFLFDSSIKLQYLTSLQERFPFNFHIEIAIISCQLEYGINKALPTFNKCYEYCCLQLKSHIGYAAGSELLSFRGYYYEKIDNTRTSIAFYHFALEFMKAHLRSAKALVQLYFNQLDFNSSKIIINNFKAVHPTTYAFLAVEALISFLEHSNEDLFEEIKSLLQNGTIK